MEIYILFFVCCLIFALKKHGGHVKTEEKLLLIVLGIFLCTSYMTGSDWRSYELDYYDVNSIEDCLSKPGEFVFYIVCMILNKLGIDFWFFWILTKFVCYYVTIKKIIQYSGTSRWWVIFFFYSYCALFYYIDNPMRNLISSIIILYNIDAFIYSRYKKAAFTLFCASLIHVSAILAAPMLLVASNLKLSLKRALLILLLIYLAAYTFWISGLSQQVTLIMTLISGDDFRGQLYMQQGADKGGIILSIGSIFQILLFVLSALGYSKTRTNDAFDRFIYNISFFYAGSLLLEVALPILGRLSMYFFLPYILFVVKYLISGYTSAFKTPRQYATIYRFVLVCFLASVIYKNITNSYRYIPYSSYIGYLFQEKPTYDYRDSYNYLKSPYTKYENNSN